MVIHEFPWMPIGGLEDPRLRLTSFTDIYNWCLKPWEMHGGGEQRSNMECSDSMGSLPISGRRKLAGKGR